MLASTKNDNEKLYPLEGMLLLFQSAFQLGAIFKEHAL